MIDLIRRYFIVDIPNENMIHALDVCIGDNSTQRYSLDGTQLFVKTNGMLLKSKTDNGVDMNTIIPPGLSTEYTLEEVLLILNGPEWTDEMK